MTTQSRHVLLTVQDIAAAIEFYQQGLGMRLKRADSNLAELEAEGTTIALHAASGMPQIAGFPVLSFQVADLFSTIEKLDELGATMEGGVRQLAFGMVAAMRSPEGHLLSLLQPANDEQLREIIQSDAGSE